MTAHSRSSAPYRRRVRIGLVASVLGGLLALGAPAVAHEVSYARSGLVVQGVALRTRGYYPIDACLRDAFTPCVSLAGRFRPEATAQARVIQELARTRGQVVGEVTGQRVQWELAPGPDSQYAPDAEDPSEPPDPPDPDVHWRIDVVVDDATILEVRRWSTHAPGDVDARLQNYRAQALTFNIQFNRNGELNVRRWSRAYPDPVGAMWCVWADDNGGLHPGNVYFERAELVPDTVRARTPGCQVGDEDESVRRMYEAEDARARAEATEVPVMFPARQTTDAEDCEGRYWVAVPMDRARTTTLAVEYGDASAVETVTIVQGEGSTMLGFVHVFPPRAGLYAQRATIVETGAYGDAETIHPQPPGHAGYPLDDDRRACAIGGDANDPSNGCWPP